MKKENEKKERGIFYPGVTPSWLNNKPGIYPGDTEGVDFVINTDKTGKFEILQLTDTQTCNPNHTRNEIRFKDLSEAYYSDGVVDFEEKCGKYIRQILRHCSPDLIVVSGDMVYGETDDSGEDWLEFIDFMDSFKIPWACCFGNHDNESYKGVRWQCEQLEKSEYCIFKRGNVTGNSNYNIVIRQKGEIKQTIYLLDTNGCCKLGRPGEGIQEDNKDYDLITKVQGIYPDQIEWFCKSNDSIRELAGKECVPNIVFQHIEMYQFYVAVRDKYDPDAKLGTIHCTEKDDFGYKIAGWGWSGSMDPDGTFFKACKDNGTTGIFFGHVHDNDASVMYDGIRLTFGSKTGTHTFYTPSLMGGTRIYLDMTDGTMKTEHIKNMELDILEQKQ